MSLLDNTGEDIPVEEDLHRNILARVFELELTYREFDSPHYKGVRGRCSG